MEAFSVTKEYVLWGDSWLNWTLLMIDKLKYNPKKYESGNEIKIKKVAGVNLDEEFKDFLI